MPRTEPGEGKDRLPASPPERGKGFDAVLGDHDVRVVGHAASYEMDSQALDAAVRRDLAAGRQPCAVVATVGTTTSTAIDPVSAIADVAGRRGPWLHVDAAMGGSAMILSFRQACKK